MAKDFEVSTSFRGSAYRYVRASDRLPRTDEVGVDSPARIKLFDPQGGWTWYIAGYDPEDRLAWGLVDGHEIEYGHIGMEELCGYRGRLGLPLERDLYWEPTPLSEIVTRRP